MSIFPFCLTERLMDYQTWFTFFAAACVIAISPGSGAVLSMSHGLNYGVRRTSATILGLEIALVVILVIAGAGVGSLLVASETAFNVIKVAGALYLIYLGFSQWRAPVPTRSTSGASGERAPVRPPAADSGSSRKASGSREARDRPLACSSRAEVMSAGDLTGHSATAPSGPKATAWEKRTLLTSM